MFLLADHFGLVGITVAAGSALVWLLSRVTRSLATREGPGSVGLTLTLMPILLAMCGWGTYPRLYREWSKGTQDEFHRRHPSAPIDLRTPESETFAQEQAQARMAALGVMIGLAVSAAAVRFGARLERVRLDQGTGTPVSAMAARATFFFLALTIAAGVILRGRARVPVILSLSGLWVPAMLLWRKHPHAGPMGPARSTAGRATFFGLAVTALGSIAIPAFQEQVRSGWMTRGIWAGIGGSTALLVIAAWLATRLAPGRAIALTGALCGVAGILLLWL
jgi:hypothetical protein